MTMRKRAGRVMFTAAAAAALVGLSVVPALAATHLTVTVTGGGSYRAAAKTTVLTDGIAKVTCASSKASGKLPSHTYRRAKAPVTVGTAKTLSFSSCLSAAGPVTTTVMSTPYAVQANSKTNSKGFTDAIITGTNVSVSATGCSFTVTGSASGYYSNRTHQLIITPKLPIRPVKRAQLTVSNVSVGNCGGLVHNGDHPTFNAIYKVSLRRLKITSR